ncbi:MAG: hypothetical protein RLZZ444_4419, partial [Pseudomonadota bacterium]
MHLEYTGLTPDGQVSHRLAATPNAFALHAEALLDRGMVPLPIAPHSKRPGVYAGRIGEWAFECRDGENVPFVESHFSRPDIALGTAYGRGIEGWQRYTVDRYRSHDAAAEGWDSEKFGPYGLADHFGEYSRMPEVGLGVLCGNGLVGLDIDSEDPALLESIRLSVADVLVDGVYVAKRGRRGFTIFFRGDVPTGKIKIAGREDAIDILATGRQSILPPTTHASSGEPYVWLSERTLFDTEASELPPISAEILAEIRAGLVRDGFDLEVVHERCEEERRHRGDGVYSDLNARALADIGAWVEDLGLYGGKWVGSRYAAVATWRPSGTGRSLTDRKLNLSVSPDGIKDFGDDVGYTPIGLVSTALGLEGQAAALWLSQRVGRKLPPLSPDSVWLTGVDQPFTLDDVEGELRRTNRRFVKRIVPQQQAREARLAALVGTDGAIVEAMRRFVDQSDILNERRAEMERREAELVARERELEAMEDEARLVGYKVGGLVELHEIRSNGAASDREFAMYVNLAKYDNPACLEALQYKEALIAEAKELSSAYPLLVESPSPGSGKTKIIAEEILAPKDIHAMVMSPINSLGWDLQARSPARAWAGLGADGPDGEPLCRRRDEAQRIEAAGGSRRKLCEGCLFFDGCPGRRMIDSWHEAPSIAGTHAHLMLGRPDEMACDVDAVVIDESPVGTLRPGHKRIELADIVLHGDEAGSLAVFRLQNVIRESVEGVGVRQADLSRLDRAGLKAARKALYRQVAERHDMSVEELMAAEPVAKLRRL